MENTESQETEEAKKAEQNNCEENVAEECQEAKVEGSDEAAGNGEVDYKEKYFYLAAEMDNLRKRMDREKSQTIKFGTENVLKDMVKVLDTFELTMNAIKLDKDEKVQNIVIGLEMVSKQFLDSLEGHGLKKVDALGKSFDPNFHEAISKEASEGKKDMEIIKVEQSGYALNGRVLRAAKVIVASN